MLHALDESRAETEAALARQREFVADASHELRTPLTSVLANLELLEEPLDGEHARPRVRAALHRADAPPGRRPAAARARRRRPRASPHQPIDLAEVVADAAAELEPVAGDHEISTRRPPARSTAPRRAAPARAEPDGERVAPHRPGTAVEATVERPTAMSSSRSRTTGRASPPSARQGLRTLLRAHGDHAGSLGSASSIVGAVAESHQGKRPARGAAGRARSPLPGAHSPPIRSLRSSGVFGLRSGEADVPGRPCPTSLPSSSSCSRSAARSTRLPITQVQEIIRYTEPRTVASDVAVGPRRDQPARQDHPGLRPRAAPRHRRDERRAARSSSSRPAPARPASSSTRSRRSSRSTTDQLEDVPPPTTRTIEAIAKVDDRLVVLLDPDGLFAPPGGAAELAAALGRRDRWPRVSPRSRGARRRRRRLRAHAPRARATRSGAGLRGRRRGRRRRRGARACREHAARRA